MENLHFSSDLINHLKSGKQVVLNNKKLYKDKLTGFYFIRTKTGLLFEYKLLSDAIVFMNEWQITKTHQSLWNFENRNFIGAIPTKAQIKKI